MKSIITLLGFALSLGISHTASLSGQGVKGTMLQASSRESLETAKIAGKDISIGIMLLNGYTGKRIANTSVTLKGKVTVMCVKPPCPTSEKKWTLTTDGEGIVQVQTEIWESASIISAAGYSPESILKGDPEKSPDSAWFIELDPDDITAEGLIRLKLIDGETGKEISKKRLWLTRHPRANIWLKRTPHCMPPQCPDYWMGHTTNRLGNLYGPAGELLLSWIYVEGYQLQRFSKDWLSKRRVVLERAR